MSGLAHTYSIIALDPDTGQMGAAVQSHYFAVGRVVPWAKPGVGVVNTQAHVEPSYGSLGLALMREGQTAPDALGSLLTRDPDAGYRQVAMLDAHGNTAVHTGANCISYAGHQQGEGYTVQANLMRTDTVWDAMATAYEQTAGGLAHRMLTALEAAQAEGGDIRGQQSAALLVVASQPVNNFWTDKPFDLRVDDSATPVHDLRRLLTIAQARRQLETAQRWLEADHAAGHVQPAVLMFHEALSAFPPGFDCTEEMFWFAHRLAEANHFDAARPIFQQVFAAAPVWRAVVSRLVQAGLWPGGEEDAAQLLAG